MTSKAIFFLYRLLQALLFPLVLLYFLLRCCKNPRYFPTLWERLGFLPREYQQTVGGAIWFHAVSVGEVIAIGPLIDRMRERYPCAEIFVSASTLAGHSTALERLKAHVFFAPVDYVFAVRHVLRTMRPALLVVAETEIWPNLFRETARTGCGIVIVNGRMSDRVAPRYAKWRRFFAKVLCHADRILVQSEEQRDRYLAAGAIPERTQVGGNIKYDFTPRDSSEWLRPFANGSRVWIAASTSADTHLNEEDFVIRSMAHMPGWKLVMAPRKPDRFDEVADKLTLSGVPFARRSRGEMEGDVLLLDTIGELGGIFPIADAVFMGGSLVDRGGHNILEPAFFAKPIVVGPHMENFREIAEDFRAHQAFVEIEKPAELAGAILAAAANPELGERAKACAEARRGAMDRAVTELAAVYEQAVPRYRRSLAGLMLLRPFAQLWRMFRRRPVREQTRLPAHVISVGNITAGGTGKTPLVLYIARQLSLRQRHVGILTRGHGRSSHHGHLLLEPGSTDSVIHTGDEAQLFLRSGYAHVGIGKNRAKIGRMLLEQYGLDTLVLDDGFQQMRLARNLNIVMVDAMNPFGEGQLLPLGRLREPMLALRRASAFVITRTECNRPTKGIEARLRQFNPNAPIFRSRVVPTAWVDQSTGEEYPAGELPFQRTLAFCGLGNPQSFWRALDQLGIAPEERIDFDDHHRYTEREIRRMGLLVKRLGAEALLTTQKDVVNLCESAEAVVAPAKILWLKIGMEIDREDEFLKLLMR